MSFRLAVDALRENVAAINRGDYEGMVAMYADGASWFASPEGALVFCGRSAIRGFYEDWYGAYAEYQAALGEVRDLGAGVLLAHYLQRGRLEGAKGFLEQRRAAVSMWAEGSIEQWFNYPEEQLDAAHAAAHRLARERGA